MMTKSSSTNTIRPHIYRRGTLKPAYFQRCAARNIPRAEQPIRLNVFCLSRKLSKRMFRRRPVLWMIVLFAVLLALLAALLLSVHAPTATAGDGREVTIEKVTYGTDHRFTQGKLWVRLLKPFLGTPWATRRGCFETRLDSTNPVMMVWTRWTGISRTNPLPLEVSIIDENGAESELVSARWNQSDWWARTNRFESTSRVAWMLQNYPRRDDPLRMRVYERDTKYNPRLVVEIALPNFGPTRHRQWSGRKTPISVTNSGVEFTLKEFRNLATNIWNAQFEVRTNGQPDSSWQIAGLYATDATGNLLSARAEVIAATLHVPVITLNGALWRGERAWKISAEFCRAFDFQPHELWTSPDLASPFTSIPGATNLSLTNVVGGCTLVLSGVYSRHYGDRATLTAWFGNMPAASRLFLVDAVNDLRRQIVVQQIASNPVGWHTFSLVVPPDSKTARFTFAVRRTTSVAFDVANPAVAQR
jgi:hypothetical protein